MERGKLILKRGREIGKRIAPTIRRCTASVLDRFVVKEALRRLATATGKLAWLRRLRQRPLKPWQRRTVLASLLLASLVVLSAYLVPLPARLGAQGSVVVYYDNGVPAHVFLAPDDRWRIRVTLNDIDPSYVDALVQIEDKRFWHHPGVDPLAILRATFQNVTRGHVVSGGSTLTMQLVRMVEPRPRTLASKVVEAWRAFQLELRLSKEEIIEAYLQFAPYGRNIEGIEAAALSYFGHRADALSPAEIATLLAVPQNPNIRYPAPANLKRLRAGRDDIANRLYGNDDARNDTYSQVVETAIPKKLRPFPREAIHAAYWLQAKHPERERIYTTLNRSLQILVEKHVKAAQHAAHNNGIHNTAVVLVDHARSSISALVGNFDFWDGEHGGQIPGFDVARSPGSLLKPFIFGMAFDEGMVLKETLVPDIPVHYGDYSPNNYDGGFRGLVRMQDALSWSLNVPFVNLLNRLGTDRFLNRLRAAGINNLVDTPGHYGLSSAIGGIEMTPLEVAGLYATLALDGAYRPLKLVTDETGSRNRSNNTETWISILTPGASYVTKQILSLRDRPDFPRRREYTRMPPRIHWKTGTSFGNRDAWAAGSGAEYTAVVWLGNFNNSPSSELVGASAAGPLLFDVLESVAKSWAMLPEPIPPDLKEIEVCAYSGYRPTPACPKTTTALALKTNVPTEPCPYHVQRDVDLKTGLSLAPGCRAGKTYETRTYKVWPASVRRWLKDQQRHVPKPPDFAPGCDVTPKQSGPRIVSPIDGTELLLISGLSQKHQELALEAESPTNGALSWFVDGEFIGSGSADGRLWWTPMPGSHHILVMDDYGRSSEHVINVRDRR